MQKRIKFLGKYLIIQPICFSLVFFQLHRESDAQVGLTKDHFSTGSNYGWSAGDTAKVVNGKFVVVMSKQTSGKYRGDFKHATSVVLHAGNYPILAIKLKKPPKCAFFLDTPLGSYNSSNNNAIKIETSTSNVYYWNIAAGAFGTAKLSPSISTTLSFLQFKVTDVELTQAQLDAFDTACQVDWDRTVS